MRGAQHLPGPAYCEPPVEREDFEDWYERKSREGDDQYEKEIERERERKEKGNE